MRLSSITSSLFRVLLAATPQEVAAQLRREFPQANPQVVQEIAGKVQNVFVARWLLRNAPQIPSIDEALANLKAFDAAKARLKVNNVPSDLAQYDYNKLVQTVQQVSGMQKSKSQIKANLPKEIVAMATIVANKGTRGLPPESQPAAKNEVLDWIAGIWRRAFDRGVKDFKAYQQGGPLPSGEKSKSAQEIERYIIETEIPGFVEDEVNYVQVVQDFFAWKMMPNPAETPERAAMRQKESLNNFGNKADLSTFLDHHMSEQQKLQRYQIDPAATEGLNILTEGDLRAIEITRWDDRFAAELCKKANWCVRDKRAFDSYGIGPDNPLWLILKGNQQLALVGFQSGQAKDVNDAPIGRDVAAAIYPIVQKISNTHFDGTLPLQGDQIELGGHTDFEVFLTLPEVRDAQYGAAGALPIEKIEDFFDRVGQISSSLLDIDKREGVDFDKTYDQIKGYEKAIMQSRGAEVLQKLLDANWKADDVHYKYNQIDRLIREGLLPDGSNPEEILDQFMQSVYGDDSADMDDMAWAGYELHERGRVSLQQIVDRLVKTHPNWKDEAGRRFFLDYLGPQQLDDESAPQVFEFGLGRYVVRAILFPDGTFVAATPEENELLNKIPAHQTSTFGGEAATQALEMIRKRLSQPQPVSAWLRGNCKFAGL